MKRLEYTAAAIRLAGIFFCAVLLSQNVEILAIAAPTRVFSTYTQPVLHVAGIPLMSGQAGSLLLFAVKAALAYLATVHPLRLARLFWMGILPGIPTRLRSVLQDEPVRRPENDPWNDAS